MLVNHKKAVEITAANILFSSILLQITWHGMFKKANAAFSLDCQKNWKRNWKPHDPVWVFVFYLFVQSAAAGDTFLFLNKIPLRF